MRGIVQSRQIFGRISAAQNRARMRRDVVIAVYIRRFANIETVSKWQRLWCESVGERFFASGCYSNFRSLLGVWNVSSSKQNVITATHWRRGKYARHTGLFKHAANEQTPVRDGAYRHPMLACVLQARRTRSEAELLGTHVIRTTMDGMKTRVGFCSTQ